LLVFDNDRIVRQLSLLSRRNAYELAGHDAAPAWTMLTAPVHQNVRRIASVVQTLPPVRVPLDTNLRSVNKLKRTS
jgi:hypothetical protein